LIATSSSATPASTPTNLTAAAVSASQINLSWSGSTGAAGYKVYRGGSLLTTVAATSSADESYSDIGLSASTTYIYAVAAYNAGNISAQSNQASATTQAAPPPQPTGYPTCDQTVKNVPADYPNIQAAVNATTIGDTVKIAAGMYNENVTLKSGICLEGAGIDQTVISKSGASGISGDGVSYVIVKNLTVKNSGCEPGSCGGGGDGGGIRLLGSSNITLQSCRLTGNAAANGGGIFASGSTITVDHCLIDDNIAHNVGAGILVQSNSTASLTNVTVANNVWSNTFGNGGIGGIGFYSSNLQMTKSILWANSNKNFSGNGSGISSSDIGGWSGGTGDINGNPMFISATDYHLQSGSPATGMGSY